MRTLCMSTRAPYSTDAPGQASPCETPISGGGGRQHLSTAGSYSRFCRHEGQHNLLREGARVPSTPYAAS